MALLEQHPQSTVVHAGPLSAQYQQGSLRYIRFGRYEVLRQVYVAVRDFHWGTVAPVLHEETIESGPDWFHIQFSAVHKAAEIDFRWSGVITGNINGAIEWALNGSAHSDFLKNRIGFCVLHPIAECAGRRCVVEHCGGSREQAQFPKFISSHQSFLNVRAISHEVVEGLTARVTHGR